MHIGQSVMTDMQSKDFVSIHKGKAMTPKYELLKDAYAIIDGIPDKVVNLNHVVSEKGESLDCGTIACAAGWLGMHPKFNKLGLSVVQGGLGGFRLHLDSGSAADNARAYSGQMAKVFNLPHADALKLFNARQYHERAGGWRALTDKQVWLRRVREYLKEEGQL